MSDFERIGGEEALRTIIETFVDRCFEDTMIGFFFQRARADRARIKRFEYQHAAAFLGAGIQYKGRDIHVAHRKHPIMGGQFSRRLMILKETLTDHAVPEDILGRWIAHQESLRSEVTGDRPDECNHERASMRLIDPKDGDSP